MDTGTQAPPAFGAAEIFNLSPKANKAAWCSKNRPADAFSKIPPTPMRPATKLATELLRLLVTALQKRNSRERDEDMTTLVPVNSSARFRTVGFTLVEVLVAIAIMGIVFVTLYTGIANGFCSIGLAREDMRASQILLEKSETLRLYTWSQVTNSVFPMFTETYNPTTTGAGEGAIYSGSFTVSKISSSSIPDKKLKDANYDDEMRVVTITLNWTNGSLPRQRSLSTYVAQDGLHNYVY